MNEYLNNGSAWHRWEPHIHTPGTLLNDQFGGDSSWNEYLRAIEDAHPRIRSLGVTDYYSTETYERVCKEKNDGRLPFVDLVFPNIELRLNIGTPKGRWVNVHLLVNPSDSDHVVQIRRFLAQLTIEAFGEAYSCSRDDLVRLGRRAKPNLQEDFAALQYGASQFKVDFTQLREQYRRSHWAQEHILIAVAGSQTDGTSGIRDGADVTYRQEIEKFAHVIFASSAAQREFWLGLHPDIPVEKLRELYVGLKPCLHGSDAHQLAKVGVPDEDRFCWLKGGLEFDTLRQACIDPGGRAFVGPMPPQLGASSRLIKTVVIEQAPWLTTPKIGLNPGLVAIIGARGSGKTALADIIAVACDAFPQPEGNNESQRPSSSFLSRARELLGGAEVTMDWGSGDTVTRQLDRTDKPLISYPRSRYLSQQFVEELCSASGMTDALLREIERVIFESHPLVARDGTLNFAELLELRASRHRQSRTSEEQAILKISDRIASELAKDQQIGTLENLIAQRLIEIDVYTKDRAKLISKGSEERAQRLSQLADSAEKVRGYIRFFNKQEQALLALQDDVTNLRTHQAPEALRRSKERHTDTRMKPEEWEAFLLDYKGDVDSQIVRRLATARKQSIKWKGFPPSPTEISGAPFISDDAKLDELSLSVLDAEIERLEKLVNSDVDSQRKFAAISKKIADNVTNLGVLNENLEDARGARERIKILQQERGDAYLRVFEAIAAEQQVLRDLYDPLMERLSGSTGTLKKLSFTVARKSDFGRWAQIAEEELLDLRRQGPFKGRGNLEALAEQFLKDSWENGEPAAACQAMADFREKFEGNLLEHSSVPKANQADYRSWVKRFAQWIFSTDHIELHYGITYDGVDIGKLSPGTRGIVLLLLYLALDDGDDRPLIIDQPEENLDPKSVYDELVGLFIAAKLKRQVIMVTHNANLVINTDADQIIIATSEPQHRGQLPRISYKSGGLENAEIRKLVCGILEGGDIAFRERARRLRVSLGR